MATGLRAHPPHKGGRMEPELQVLSEGHVPAVHTHRNKGCGLVNEKWVTYQSSLSSFILENVHSINEDNGKAWGLFIQYIWKFTINM